MPSNTTMSTNEASQLESMRRPPQLRTTIYTLLLFPHGSVPNGGSLDRPPNSRQKGFGDDATIMVQEWGPAWSAAPPGRRRRDAAM
jgi:hypothetical protein